MGHISVEAVARWTGLGNAGLVLRSETAGGGHEGSVRGGK